jgi:4-hydroxy-4-methyl-2-oxoglutarate aldolase
MMVNLAPAVLEKLKSFDTPTICNVIELFDVRPRASGYMDGRIRACFPEMPPMVGFASTATFRSAAPSASPDIYVATGQQIRSFPELSGPAIVVFQDLDNPSAGATFGEMMCTSYRAYGAVGLVTSGTGRDLDAVRKLGFPVFTNGEICSHGYCHTPQIGVPVQVGGLTVYPDDLLHGDCNGVTSIPKEIAAEVADAAAEFVAIEGGFLQVLNGPRPSFAGFDAARQEERRRTAELRQRVSRHLS